MNNNFVIIVVLLLYAFYSSGCAQKNQDDSVGNKFVEESYSASRENLSDVVMPIPEYIKWVQDPENGLRKEKTVDEINFVVQYKPHEYIVCMEERVDEIYDTLLKRKVTELEGVQYYDLKIILTEQEGELLKFNLRSSADYDKRVKYFAFEMQNDIILVEGNDTLACVLYHFERTYDVAPSCTILLGFEEKKENITKQRTLVVHDKSFNKGLLKFAFREGKFQGLPKLETK